MINVKITSLYIESTSQLCFSKGKSKVSSDGGAFLEELGHRLGAILPCAPTT